MNCILIAQYSYIIDIINMFSVFIYTFHIYLTMIYLFRISFNCFSKVDLCFIVFNILFSKYFRLIWGVNPKRLPWLGPSGLALSDGRRNALAQHLHCKKFLGIYQSIDWYFPMNYDKYDTICCKHCFYLLICNE